MAYVMDNNGEQRWLAYEERSQLIAEYEEEQALLMRLIETGDVEEQDVDRLEFLTDELVRLKRVHRGEYDVLYFALTYFSEEGNPDNADNLIPDGVDYDSTADFHKELCGLLGDIADGSQTKNTAWSCPRGSAKTSYLSNIFIAHQVAYRHRRYIVLVSETTEVAGTFLSWTRYQLKLNEKLRNDFGEQLYVKPSMNGSDNKYEFITTTNTKVEAKGLQVQMRGLRHGSSRVDLFVLDDLESKESTNTRELIEKSKQWFDEEMLPAMSRNGQCVYLGTILCYGSLLHHVIKDRKDFKSQKYAAVKTFAEREDLWTEWRNIYRRDDENSADKAMEYYQEHEDEMLKGVSLLWPQVWTYYDFMIIREESGAKAFNQEYLNNPTDEERQIFKPEYFVRSDDEDLVGKNIRYYAGIDIAMGKETGDFSVITTIARNEDTGVCYVYDAFIERCHPDVLLDRAVEYTMRYQYERIGIEAQLFQEFIANNLTERLQKNGYPGHTRVKQIKQRTRKALRIESMLPDVQSGKIRFHKNLPREFMDQFEMYGAGGNNDDAPDSCHMAYSTAQSGQTVMRTVRKRMR